MDVYHLIGALFMKFCIIVFCKGRIQASAPPFVLHLFQLSNACAFLQLSCSAVAPSVGRHLDVSQSYVKQCLPTSLHMPEH